MPTVETARSESEDVSKSEEDSGHKSFRKSVLNMTPAEARAHDRLKQEEERKKARSLGIVDSLKGKLAEEEEPTPIATSVAAVKPAEDR